MYLNVEDTIVSYGSNTRLIESIPFDVLSRAVTAENKLWKMKKMVKILMPLPIIQNMKRVMKICILELVAISMSFFELGQKYLFDHLFFARQLNVGDSGISGEAKGFFELFVLFDLGGVVGVVEVELPLGHRLSKID